MAFIKFLFDSYLVTVSQKLTENSLHQSVFKSFLRVIYSYRRGLNINYSNYLLNLPHWSYYEFRQNITKFYRHSLISFVERICFQNMCKMNAKTKDLAQDIQLLNNNISSRFICNFAVDSFTFFNYFILTLRKTWIKMWFECNSQQITCDR